MLNRLQSLLMITGILSLSSISTAWANPISAEAPPAPSASNTPATTVAEWLAQIEASLTQITSVQVGSTESGLSILLETAGGELESPTTEVVGNALIIEIPDAVLALQGEEAFEQFSPGEGIALVSIVNRPGNQVQMTITGTDAPPVVDLTGTAASLIVSITPGVPQADVSDDAIQIVVTGEQDEGYNPSRTSTATRTDTPIRNVPFSIQVIPEEVLEDRNVVELGDALETAGSVVSAGGRGTSVFGPGFLIRGFPVNGFPSRGIFRDGIPTVSLAPLSTSDIERVEILRGPASVLFGQGDPGGIINLVPKEPLNEPFYEASFTAGSFDTYRGALDFSGPLGTLPSVRYRVNVSYENFGSFRDFVDGERVLFSPTLTWDIGENTSLNVYGQYVSDRETIDEGIIATEDGILDLPRDRFLGEDFGEFSQDQFRLGYQLNHRFNDVFSLRHSFQYFQFEPSRFAPLFDSFDPATGTLERLAFFAGGITRQVFTNAELLSQFNTGSVEHRVLLGVEYRHDDDEPEFQFSELFEPINVFDPVYTDDPFDIDPDFFRDDTIDTIAVYLQDQVEILPNLILLAGVRFDSVDQFRTTQFEGEARAEFNQVDSEFTPRFGIVYQPIEPISLYASFTRSFNPSFGTSRNPDDTSFEPETGRQFEVGIKADLSEQLSLTFAAFDIRKQNVSTPDPDNPFFSVQTGEVASRGLELNLGGEVLPGWDITAAYTLLDAFVSEDNTDVVGNGLANVPDNQFSLWSTYEIQRGDLAGLGFGLGFFFVGDRPGNLSNTFELPSYFRTDAALFYERNNWRAQLNLENVFDIEYFTSSDEFLGVTPGAPLTVLGEIAIEF